VLCLSCQRENPADARFCNGCGQALKTAGPAPGPGRRPLTVLFADIVDSVRQAATLDPEDWRSILARYHTASRLAIGEHGGLIRQYLGDGILAYFGFPSAGETDAANAIHAGIDLQERVAALARDLEAEFQIELDVRIGIHSGLVVVGEAGVGDGAQAHAFGNTINVAARLQGVAEPKTVVISSATQRLVEGLFVVEPLGLRELRGLPEPVEVLRVKGATEVTHRLDAATPGRLSPFVGREAELRRVLEVCTGPSRSFPRILWIRGEAGVGKSRLLREARDRVAAAGAQWLQGRCLPDTEQSPFASWRNLLQNALGLHARATATQVGERLEASCEALELDGEPVRRLAELLGAVEANAAASLAADHRRQTIDALVTWLRSQAAKRPIVVGIEDLHWADPSTLAVLAQAERDLADSAVIFLLTGRPEATAPLERAEDLNLSGLGPAESRALARALAGGEVDDDHLAAIVERGSGLPLYIEELLREGGGVADERAGVPPGLWVSLAARLDRLGPARELAQIAAVMGVEAPIALLARLTGRSESLVLDQAAQIVSSGLARWSHDDDGPVLHFAHALMADAAYHSLPKDRRHQLHADVAEELEASSHETRPEVIARHYESAENFSAAMSRWRRASRLASRAHALDEAGAHLERAVACLERLSPNVSPASEMKLRLAQIDFFNIRHGFTGTPQRAALDRVAELVDDDTVDRMSRFAALLSLTTQSAAVSQIEDSKRWAERAEAVARESALPMLIGFLGAPAGTARLLNGHYTDARQTTESSIEALGVESPANLDARVAEAWVMTQCIRAHSHATLGWTGEARTHLDHAIEGARSVDPLDPHTLGTALYFRAMLSVMEGDYEACSEDAREMRAIGDQYGFAEVAAVGRMYEACREMIHGDAARGVADFREQQAKVPGYKPFAYLNQLFFEGVARSGDRQTALQDTEKHHQELVARGELHCSEEFHALVGELRWSLDGDLAAARAACERGLDEATERHAHGPRLRIATRLARILYAAGEARQAAAALEDVVSSYPDPNGSRRHGEAVALLSEIRRRDVETQPSARRSP